MASSRPFTLSEAFKHVWRRWYMVLLVGLVGSAAVVMLRGFYRPQFQSEANFRIIPQLAPPRMDETVQIPREPTPDPVPMAKALLESALSNRSLDELFSRHPEVYQQDISTTKHHRKFLKFVRKHARIVPRTDSLFRVEARAKSPEAARLLTEWISQSAVEEHRKALRERADALAQFTADQAASAQKALEAQEDQMVAFLRANPSLLVSALDSDRRLGTSGADRMRVRATQRLLDRTGRTVARKDARLKSLLDERTRLRAELRALDDSGAPTTTASAKLRELQQAQARLRALHTEGLSDEHPTIKRAKRVVERLQQQARTLQPGEKSGTVAFASKAHARIRKVDALIRAKLKSKQQDQSKLPQLEAKWGQLLRAQQLLLRRYDSLSRLAAATTLASRLGEYQDRQLAAVTASASTPIRPKGVKRWMVVVAGAGLSFTLGLGLALLLGAFDRRLHSHQDVENLLRLPLLAVMPHQPQPDRKADQWQETLPTNGTPLITWSSQKDEVEIGCGPDGTVTDHEEEMIGDGGVLALPAQSSVSTETAMVRPDSVVVGDLLAAEATLSLRIKTVPMTPPIARGLFISTAPHSTGADQMRLLAGRLLETQTRPIQIILVAGWERNSGRSTVAANLGMALAESRRRTLLVDACGGDAALTRLFGLEPEAGTTLYDQIMARVGGPTPPFTLYKIAESLSVVPADQLRRPMAPMLSSHAFSSLMQRLQNVFDVIVVDSAALAVATDAAALQQEADAVVLVARRKHSTLTGVSHFAEQLGVKRLAGVVFSEHG